MKLRARGLFRTTLVVGALTLGVAATAGPSQPEQEPDRWVAVGSTKNNASSKCNGVNNPKCPGNGPVKTFGVALGQIPLMFPGSSAPLSVRFSNPEAFPIRVQTLDVTASKANTEDCPMNELVYPAGRRTYSPAIVVPARSSVSAPALSVGLKSTADHRCENATFTIRVVATAVK